MPRKGDHYARRQFVPVSYLFFFSAGFCSLSSCLSSLQLCLLWRFSLRHFVFKFRFHWFQFWFFPVRTGKASNHRNS